MKNKLLSAIIFFLCAITIIGCSNVIEDLKEKENPAPAPVSNNPYLTFKGNGTFELSVNSKNWNGKLDYSTDKKNWTEDWDGTTPIPAAASNGSYYVYLRGKGNTTFSSSYSNNTTIGITGTATAVECKGNIMTLLDWENPGTATMGEACFYRLFKDCKKLTKAPDLPSMYLSEACYMEMFAGCTALVTAPVLPATTLTDGCYFCMFSECTSLEASPELPATTVTETCYNLMFNACSSLSSIGKISAKVIDKNGAMNCMFHSCSNIKVVETTNPEEAFLTVESADASMAVYEMFGNTKAGGVTEPEAGKSYTLAKPITGTVKITDNPEESKLTANYSGTETVTYQWYKNGTEISGETSSTYTYDVATMGGNVLFVKVSGKDKYQGTVSSNSVTVISGEISANYDFDNNLIIATYTGDISEGDLKYTWYKKNASDVYEIIPAVSGSSLYDSDYFSFSNYKIVIKADNYCGCLIEYYSMGCVIAGTKIEMKDGSYKSVENIDLGDEIKSYDFNTGTFVSNKVVCLDEAFNKTKQVLTLTTANGYSISFVDIQAFFDVETKNYIDISSQNFESMIGKTILVKEGETLVETKIENITSKIETVSYFELITEKTFNFIADGFMTVIPESLLGRPVYDLLDDEYKYDPVKKEQDIQTYGFYTYETFPINITKEFFDAYDFAVYKIYVGKGYVTLEEIEEHINWHLGSTVKNAVKVR